MAVFQTQEGESQNETPPSCSTCVCWTPAQRLRKLERQGLCDAPSRGLIEIEGVGGCPECDPYSMNEVQLLTRASFYCGAYRKKEE